MANVLTITNLKQNILEFTAGLEGLNDNDMQVRLIIEANGMDLGFDAKRIQGTTWEVVIPPLPMLEKTAYPFRMDVVSEGYFFAPLQGIINVVGTHELYVTDPTNRNLPARDIEGLPKKHVAKPKGTKEVEDDNDKVAPKVLKPIRPKMSTTRDPNIADIAARFKAMQKSVEKVEPEVLKKEVKVVTDTEKEVEKKKPTPLKKFIKKLEVGGKKPEPKKEEREFTKIDIDGIIEKARKKARKIEDKEEEIVKKAEKVEAKKEPEKEPEKPEPKKVEAKKVEPLIKSEKKKEPVKEAVVLTEDNSDGFDKALKTVSKPIPKKRRAPKKVKAKPKAGTIKKLTEDKTIVSKPEDEVKLEAKKEEAVKDILSESDDTKKVVTHPIKKKGKITYH